MERVAVPGFEAPVVRQVDVLVVGGGPAGFGAAVSAAQDGVSVLLAEHYGFLGGAHASGDIGTFAGLYATDSRRDIPELLCGTLARSVLSALRGVTSSRRPQAAVTGPQRWFNTFIEVYDPFWLRCCLDRVAASAGVEVLFHATALQPLMDGQRVVGVLFATKAGIVAVRAKAVVDATGDADLVARAGGAFRMAEDGVIMHPSMQFRMFGVDTERLRYLSWTEIAEIMRAEGGRYGLNRFFPGVFLGVRCGEVLLNVTKPVRADGRNLDMLDLWDASYAESAGREACATYERFFRDCVPGFEKARINQTGSAIAVRETRLVEGEYRLTGDDVLSGRRFDDGIAESAWPMERMEGETVELTWAPDGSRYQIPYRALLPKGLDGILVAGRCLSAERAAHASARTWGACMDMGEAAGLAAARAIDGRLRDVDVGAMRRRLQERLQ